MPGFLSLYQQTERVPLGGDYWVDIRCHVAAADLDRAESVHVAQRVESMLAKTEGTSDDAEVRSVATTINQRAYELELLAAYILDWNLTDELDNPLPLPPFQAPRAHGDDPANQVRRASIRRLPVFATKRILKRITEMEKRGADDDDPFPGTGEGAHSAP